MASKTANAIQEKNLQMRDHLWPNNEDRLWHRKAHSGFASIPKTMPIVLHIMDEMTKGRPVSQTYFGIWCSTWDNSYAVLSKPRQLASAAGFSGQRAEYTWGERVRLLSDLKFIEIREGTAGPYHFALVPNPHFVIQYHREQKTIGLTDRSYNMLFERALEIGANDFTKKLPDGVAWKNVLEGKTENFKIKPKTVSLPEVQLPLSKTKKKKKK